MRTPLSGRGFFDLQVLALLGVLLWPQDPAPSVPPDEAPAASSAVVLDAQVVESIVGILTPPAGGEAPDPLVLVEAIQALGQPAIPVVVAMLIGELDAPAVVPGSEDVPVHPRALEERATVLQGALARLPNPAVLAHLAQRLRAEPHVELRLMLAAMLGKIDDLEACKLLVEAIEGVDPLQMQARHVQTTLESALTAHLLWDPSGSLDVVWRSGLDAPAERLGVYARAVGATRTARGVELLLSWLDRNPEANVEILKQLASVRGPALSDEVLAAVRSQLRAPNLEVRRSALVAAGSLRDETAFDDLVTMLEGEPELVAASARWSLKTICGADLGPEPQAWLEWREREQTWMSERAPVLLEDLASDVPGVVLQAVAELARHPFHRHAVTEALGPLTEHADPNVARSVCDAVGRLESNHSVPWLIAALNSSDAGLQRQAAQALQRLTGLDLPPEHDAWARALQAG